MKKGPYEVLSAEEKYKNPWITVTEEKVIRPDGKEGIFGVVDYGKGVTVAALDSDNNIYLVKEYYYALETYALQLPSGDIAEGESPQQAAQRELLEEAGAVASEWTDLGMTNPFTMIIRSPAYLFLARGTRKQQEPEPETELVVVPFEEAYRMVMESTITHGPSCIAILKTKLLLEGK